MLSFAENKLRGLLKRVYGARFRATVHAQGGRVGARLVCFGRPLLWRRRAGGLTIGDDVVLSSWQWANPINPPGRVRLSLLSPEATIVIGERSGLSVCTISAEIGVEIGVEALIGAGVMITDTDFHILNPSDRRYNRGGAAVGAAKVTIGDRVWIGAGATILKGVSIGSGSIVAAGSVVTSDVPSGILVAGCPARIVRTL